MNWILLVAGLLTIMVGLVHSILGEILIFKKLRKGSLVPTMSEPLLPERSVRIIWASWHIGTIFGCALGAILLKLSFSTSDAAMSSWVIKVIAFSMVASSLLVFIATKARHPGWVGLLVVAVLCWIE